MIGESGEPTHENSIRSQSRDGSVSPNRTPPAWNRGTSSIPTLFSCRWMISNVSPRSWLPAVVWKRNDSLPTRGHEKMSLLLAFGVSGPPVQPCAFRLRDHGPLAERMHGEVLPVVGRLERLEHQALQRRQAGYDVLVQRRGDLGAVDAGDQRLADVGLLQGRVPLGAELDVDVLVRVADLAGPRRTCCPS